MGWNQLLVWKVRENWLEKMQSWLGPDSKNPEGPCILDRNAFSTSTSDQWLKGKMACVNSHSIQSGVRQLQVFCNCYVMSLMTQEVSILLTLPFCSPWWLFPYHELWHFGHHASADTFLLLVKTGKHVLWTNYCVRGNGFPWAYRGPFFLLNRGTFDLNLEMKSSVCVQRWGEWCYISNGQYLPCHG